MSTEGRTIGKNFEYINFHAPIFLELLMTDLKDNPSTIYKYYSYGYGTYNVFLLIMDTALIAGVIIGVAMILASIMGKP